jgi:hypothetical protein
VRGLAGPAGRSARLGPDAKRALQERGGFSEPPGAGQAGRLEHVSVQCVVHVRSFLGFVRRGQATAGKLIRLVVENVIGAI